MLQQKEDSDGSLGSPSSSTMEGSKITWKTSLRALFYKSLKIQQRNYCANICQIITPLLCVAFTLVIRIISQDIVTSQIEQPKFPMPFNMPDLYQLLPFDISCKQLYLYDYDGPNLEIKKEEITKFLDKSLKRYCAESKGLQPIYNYTVNMNKFMIDTLNQAQKQPFINGQDMNVSLADGIFKFHKFEPNKLDVTIAINDYRLSQYHHNNGVSKLSLNKDSLVLSYLLTTQGMMSLLQTLSRNYLNSISQDQIILGSYMYMPFTGLDTSLLEKTTNVIGTGLYPLGLSLLLPLFLYSIVSQKEERLLEIMRMNGLNLKYYWINTFGFNFAVSMITFAVFYGFGRFVLELGFFVQTSWYIMWILLIGWGIAQISMMSFVQIFIKNGKSATIVGYLLSIFSSLVGETIAIFVYSQPMLIPNWLLLYPPVSLCRAIYIMGISCATTGCITSFQYSDPQLIKCIIILYLWFFVFLLSIWLNDKVQQEYGVAKNIGFISKIKRFINRSKTTQFVEFSEAEIEMKDTIDNDINETVKQNYRDVMSLGRKQKSLVIKQLMKKYNITSGKADYVALKPFTFALQQKEIFGLLGPNGAGKTTLISVLTGMYPKSEGNAWINGLQVGSDQINSFIGVCPQFDLLWPSLTVYEHLKFYALLKGIESIYLEVKINEYLRDVDLQEWRDKPTSQLSGGMQRRLSIAIALVGNPCVVFLDEPSSGLDPTHRRKLWNILSNCKNKTSIILTTHLMEEAEALCNRIGIISQGSLKCIGKTQQLKSSFGEGYRLYINFVHLLSPDNQKIVTEIQSKFDAKILNILESRVVFKVDKQKILQCIGWLKHEKSINWLVSQPSLYDVFMNFIE